jgi:hypothetical protein
MPAPQTKVITKLLERRQIEAGLRQMREASGDLELRWHAQRIAALGTEVIPAIIGNLDEADARMVTAMGTVALFLDREEVVQALRHAVLTSRLTDQGRVGAMTILQRFLGQGLDEQLLKSLEDPEGVILSSLEDVLQQAAREPGTLVPYVEALDRQEPDRVLGVVRSLVEVAHWPDPLSSLPAGAIRGAPEPEGVVTLLRMMAQDVRDEIAAAALDALGSLRLREAARALQSLLPAMAPHLQPVTERYLRKLQFSGVEVSPLLSPEPGWRALVSPPGGRGEQSVWFLFQQNGEKEIRFLNVMLHDRAGAVEAVGHPQVPALMLPPRRKQGHVHDVALPDGSGVMLALEASFDLGRRLVRDALADNRETQIPVAGSLRLLSPWLWEVAGADDLPLRRLPDLGRTEETDPAGRSASLLGLPAFVGWSLRGELLLGAAEELLQSPGRDLDRWVRRLADELFSNPEVLEAFQQRLTAMSEWLLLAGDEASSRLALVTARALARRPASQPFVQALVWRDLNLLVQSLQDREHASTRE